jgi:Aspartyl protease
LLRFAYKHQPNQYGGVDFTAVLSVRLSNPAKHSPPTKNFEAIIDSGASQCLFHSDIGEAIGLNIEKGTLEETTGVSGERTKIYVHPVTLYVPGGHMVRIEAGFTDKLPVAGLLGMSGFFEHFKITFDPSATPPGFELDRFYRA